MIPAPFEYEFARDIGHAIQLLARSGGEAKLLALLRVRLRSRPRTCRASTRHACRPPD